jgi:hypothetical protein
MKKIVLLAIGAIGLYQVAKKYNITSWEDLKGLVMPFLKDLNLKDLLTSSAKERMATA